MATAPSSGISAFVVMAHTHAIDSRPGVDAGGIREESQLLAIIQWRIPY
jgi:hypothetical protein